MQESWMTRQDEFPRIAMGDYLADCAIQPVYQSLFPPSRCLCRSGRATNNNTAEDAPNSGPAEAWRPATIG